MFKSLAIAVLPIVALAAKDGSNFENAYETELISTGAVTMVLATYNSENKTAGVDELHGELRVEWGSDAAPQSKFANFGFCIKNGDTYDCLSANAELSKAAIDANPAAAGSFTLTDGYYTSNAAIPGTNAPLPTSDDGFADREDAAKNWRSITSKSSKTITDVNAAVGYGTAIAHFYRDFTTNSAAQDLQVQQDTTFADGFGWWRAY